MFGIEESILLLAAVIALLGLVPSGMALAADRARGTAGAEKGMRPAGLTKTPRHGSPLRQSRVGRQVVPGPEEAVDATDNRGPSPTARAAARWRPGPNAWRSPAVKATIGATAITRAEGTAPMTELEWEHGAWRLRTRDAATLPAWLQADGWTGPVGAHSR
jgi:hypothetical protein